MKNGIAILKDKSAAPYKINHTLTIWPSNHEYWYLSKGVQNLYPHTEKSMYRCL